MTRSFAAFAALAVLGVAAVLSDQWIARRVERVAGQYLTSPLGGPATVRVTGEPFLTQALRGRYHVVEVTGTALHLGELNNVDLRARLSELRLPAAVVLGGRPFELTCEHVDGEVLIPYGELARIVRLPALVFRHERDRLLVSATLPVPSLPRSVPGLGRYARITGEAILTVRPGGAVWLRVRDVSVAGFGMPSALSQRMPTLISQLIQQLTPSLTVPMTVPQLPYGLRVDDLRPTPTGLVVTGSASGVELRRSPDPEG